MGSANEDQADYFFSLIIRAQRRQLSHLPYLVTRDSPFSFFPSSPLLSWAEPSHLHPYQNPVTHTHIILFHLPPSTLDSK